MNTLKPIEFSIFAISASLMLLLAVEFIAGRSSGGATLTTPASTSAIHQSSAHDLHQPPSVVQDKSDLLVASPAQPQADQLAPVIHPELVSIVDLENQSPQSAFSVLLPMLSHDDPAVRLAAIEALGDMNYPAAAPALTTALEDPNPQLRVAALEALALQEAESAASSIEPYLYDRHREVRVAAIAALMDLELASTVHALAGLLSDQDMLIRHQAVQALGEIGGEPAHQYLEQMRYDPNPSIRTNVLAILEETN